MGRSRYAGLRLYQGKGSRRLRGCLVGISRPSVRGDGLAGAGLPRPVERRATRGDVCRTVACGGDQHRRQPGCGGVCGLPPMRFQDLTDQDPLGFSSGSVNGSRSNFVWHFEADGTGIERPATARKKLETSHFKIAHQARAIMKTGEYRPGENACGPDGAGGAAQPSPHKPWK